MKRDNKYQRIDNISLGDNDEDAEQTVVRSQDFELWPEVVMGWRRSAKCPSIPINHNPMIKERTRTCTLLAMFQS